MPNNQYLYRFSPLLFSLLLHTLANGPYLDKSSRSSHDNGVPLEIPLSAPVCHSYLCRDSLAVIRAVLRLFMALRGDAVKRSIPIVYDMGIVRLFLVKKSSEVAGREFQTNRGKKKEGMCRTLRCPLPVHAVGHYIAHQKKKMCRWQVSVYHQSVLWR